MHSPEASIFLTGKGVRTLFSKKSPDTFSGSGRCSVLLEEIAEGEGKEQWYDGAMESCHHGFGFGWAWKKSQMASLALRRLVALPRMNAGKGLFPPGQMCPWPSMVVKMTSVPSRPPV